MKKRIKNMLIFLLVFCALITFLFAANPSGLPLPALFIPFILIYIMAFIVAQELSVLLFKNMSAPQKRWSSVVISVIPVALLLVMSAGQTGPGDIALFLVLMILVTFYLGRSNF